jgi:two-component system chemotaxis response regulator CheB
MADNAAQTSPTRDLVVIGASAGGVAVLRLIASQLPPSFPAAVLVVLHTGAYRSQLASILEMAGSNPAREAQHGEPVRAGQILVAAPDHHLTVRDGLVQLTRGPKEHHTRPAIDPLFRSAALRGGPRVIGVLLTGGNEDGTAGLQAIKACGGLAVVQDPAEAEAPTMPAAALANVDVDYCVPAAGIAPLLTEFAGSEVLAPHTAPEGLVREHAVSLMEVQPMDALKAIGKPSTLVCPDCGGALFELDATRPQRFRCHTGHAFTLNSLRQTQEEATEAALWSAIRAINDKATLLRKVAALDRMSGDERHADMSETEARRLDEHSAALRRLVDEA